MAQVYDNYKENIKKFSYTSSPYTSQQSRFDYEVIDYNKMLMQTLRQQAYRNISMSFQSPNISFTSSKKNSVFKQFLVLILIGIANAVMIPYAIVFLKPSDAYFVTLLASLGLVTITLLFVSVNSLRKEKH